MKQFFQEWYAPLLGGMMTWIASWFATLAVDLEPYKEYTAMGALVIGSIFMLRYILGENSRKIDQVIERQETNHTNHRADQAELLDALRRVTEAGHRREADLSKALKDATAALAAFKCHQAETKKD